MCKRSRLASVCKITQAWTASKTSAMGDEPAKRQIVRRFSQLMKSLPGFWSVACTALKVRHHHRVCSEANILPGFLFLTSSSVIRGFHRLNSVLFHCQVSTGALNGDASPSAKIKSAAGDARAGKALALIRGVGVEGGAALPGSGLTDAPRRLLDGSVLKLKMAIGWDRSFQHCLRVTPTQLCNHNNHNNVTRTRIQGQESNSLLQILLKVSGGVKWCDVQADCSVTSARVKAPWIFFQQTPHALSQLLSPWYSYNSCTVSASPSSSCFSVMEPVAFMARRLGGWEEHTSTARRFQPSTTLPHAMTVAALSTCFWVVSGECLLRNCREQCVSQLPNKQDSQSAWHFILNGWLLYITQCIWEGEQRIKQTNMSAQLESQVVPSAIWITMETAKYTISTPVCSSSTYCILHVCVQLQAGHSRLYYKHTIWSSRHFCGWFYHRCVVSSRVIRRDSNAELGDVESHSGEEVGVRCQKW